jgi:hypothetical protein
MALARLAALCFLIVLPLAPALAQETPEDYPSGPGRETTFYACTPCHGFQIVAQQGQTRAQWEETLDIMTRRHGMPPIEGDFQKMVLDYLEATFPPRTRPGGWQNPFAK